MIKKRFSIRPRLLLLAAAFSFGLVSGAHALDVFHVGNSLTNTSTPQGIEAIAEGSGYDHSRYIVQSAGAPLWFNWPKTENIDPMSSQVWDAMTLQPFHFYRREYRFADYYIKAMTGQIAIDQSDPLGVDPPDPYPVAPQAGEPTGQSPNVVVYIYEQAHPDLILSGEIWTPYSVEDPRDEDLNNYYVDYATKMIEELQADNPGVTIRKVAAAQAFYELNQRIMAGEIPGMTSLRDTLPGIHPNDTGGYILGLSFYSSLYQTNPIGAIVPPDDYIVPADWVLPMQESVWTVVSRDPQIGIADSVVVSSPSLPRALEDSVYTAQLEAKLAQGVVGWSIAQGTLPAGLTLAADGSITGTTQEFGIFPITFRVEDEGGFYDERRLFLFVDSDTPPVITTTALESVPFGAFTEQQLEGVDGVPPYSWEITKGYLPRGMSMSEGGVLTGTPLSTQGTYALQVTLTDSSPASTTATADLTLNVAAPEVGTVVSHKTETSPIVDGVIDEPMWVLSATANHVREEGSDNTTNWGVLWDDQYLYFAVDVTDGTLVSDSEDLREDDAVQIFLDALHDRESDYNADDRQIVVTADGRYAELNDRPDGILHAVTTTAAGYQVEVAVPWSNLELTPGAAISLGIDVGVVDDDGGSGDDGREGYNVWLGGKDDPAIPAQFGNLVCLSGQTESNILFNGSFDVDNNGTEIDTPEVSNKPTTRGYNVKDAVPEWADIAWQISLSYKSCFFRISDDEHAQGDGWPGTAAWAYGDPDAVSPTALIQLVQDNKNTKGQGYLTMDIRNPSESVTISVFGYNAVDATQLESKLSASIRGQRPIDGGQFDAELLNTTLAMIGDEEGYRQLTFPVDFADGYDYILIGFANIKGDAATLYTFIDNISLGEAASGMTTYYGTPSDAELSLETIFSETIEGVSGDPLRFRVTRDVVDNFAHPFELSLTATGDATVDDFITIGSFAIPPREQSILVDLRAKADEAIEDDETATFQLVPGGNDNTVEPETTTTIREHPLSSWLKQYHGDGPYPFDADNNAIPDAFEFVAGSDPLDPSSYGVLSLDLAPTPEGDMQLEAAISMQDNITQVVDIYVQVSDNLIDWQTYQIGSSTLPKVSQSPGTFGQVHSFLAPNLPLQGDNSKAFARWSITRR